MDGLEPDLCEPRHAQPVREPEDRRIDKGRTDAAASHPSDGRLEERTWMNY